MDDYKRKMKSPVISMWVLMWKYAKGRRGTVGLFFLLESISTIFYMFDPYIIGRAFNFVQESPAYSRYVFDVFVGHLLLLFFLVVIRWVFWGSGRILEISSAFHIANAYKLDMIRSVLHMPIEWHQENHSGKTIDKIKRAADALEDYAAGVFELVDAFWKLAGGFIALLLINWFAGGFAMFVSFISIMVIMRIDRYIATLLKKVYSYENKVAAAIHDFITNATTVISLKLQSYALKDIFARMQKSFPTFKKKAIINEQKWGGIDVIITAMVMIAMTVYAFLILKRGEVLLIGTLTMIFTYLKRIADVFYMTAWRFGRIVEQDAKAVAASDLLLDASFVEKVHNAERLEWKKVELKKVSFMYKNQARRKKSTGIFNMNLRLEKGKNIAFVGMSGGGKSTAMSILKGFYMPEKGQVLIDGKVAEHHFDTLSDEVAYIPQDPEIFQNTVKYNVALGESVSVGEIDEMLELSNFNEVLKRLKATTSLNIAEKGVTLSGGEKQRLALARGLLFARDKSIICMDEPTSSVDAKGELKIFKGIFKKFHDRTIIASVHRFHLLSLFDYIYVFKEGRVVGEGTFRELKKSNPEFKLLLRAYKDAEELEEYL